MTGLSVVKSESKSFSFSPCGCSVHRLQLHQIDDVDHADFQLGQMFTQDRNGGQRLQRRHVAGAGHDHVRLGVAVAAGPFPDADALGAMHGGLFHRQPMRGRVFARDHDIDVVPAAQAVVHHREQAVRVGRQVHAHDRRLLVDDVVDEPRVLVREAVVILPPDVRGQQVIQRRDLAPPRQVRGDLEPLRVLVEHRVHDVDERLVAVEQSVPSGEQIALQPTLALVLAEHLHHAAGRGEKLVSRHGRGVPLARGHFKERFQAVGKRLVGTEDPEILLPVVELRHVAQEPSRARAYRPARRCPAPARPPHSRGSRACANRAAASRRSRAGLEPMRRSPFGRKFGQFRLQAALLVEEFLGPVASQPVFQHLEMFGMGGRVGERHLVRAERAFDLFAIDDLRPGPALR